VLVLEDLLGREHVGAPGLAGERDADRALPRPGGGLEDDEALPGGERLAHRLEGLELSFPVGAERELPARLDQAHARAYHGPGRGPGTGGRLPRRSRRPRGRAPAARRPHGQRPSSGAAHETRTPATLPGAGGLEGGAEEGTGTPTALGPLAPQASASTNPAPSAPGHGRASDANAGLRPPPEGRQHSRYVRA